MIRLELLFLILVTTAVLVFSSSANAALAPHAYFYPIFQNSTTHQGPFATAAAACSASGGYIEYTDQFNGSLTTGLNASGVAATAETQTASFCRIGLNSNQVLNAAFCQGTAPSSGNASATCATCPTGYTDQGGVCTKVVCPSAGTQKSSGFYLLGPNPDATIPNTACDGSCETSYSGQGVTKRAMVNGVYQYYFGEGNYSYTGAECASGTPSPSSGSVPPNTCNSATQDTGQVNGVTVCIDKQKTDSTNTTESPLVTNPDGSTTKTTTSTSTDPETGKITETVLTTNTAPDGTVTTSESKTVTNPQQSSFCQANPTDPSCNTPTDACLKNPDLVGCHNLGDVPAGETIGTVELPVNATVTPVGNGGSCPAPASLTFMGQAITWSYQPLCDFAAMIRPLIIGFSWLSFGLIVAAGVRK